jgi:ketosteroid isomerase-like protein
MSQENVELARRAIEVFNADGLDGAVATWHPEIEMFDPPEFPDADRHVGVDAVRARAESYMSDAAWDGVFRDIEYIDAGNEVVVISHLRGDSAQFGGTVPIPPRFTTTMAQVYLFEDGKIRRIRQYLSRAEALEAAGLAE